MGGGVAYACNRSVSSESRYGGEGSDMSPNQGLLGDVDRTVYDSGMSQRAIEDKCSHLGQFSLAWNRSWMAVVVDPLTRTAL